MSREESRQKHVYGYRITARGDWVCQGNPVDDPDLVCLLSRSLKKDPQGGYRVRCQGEVHPVRVEDAPLRIDRVEVCQGLSGDPQQVDLILTDGRVCGLSDSLTVSAANRLYVTPVGTRLQALFSRRAFYELTRFMEQGIEGYYIPLAGERYYIKTREDPNKK